ncbi:MAG: permease [Candidatus Fermentibacteria bacterium]
MKNDLSGADEAVPWFKKIRWDWTMLVLIIPVSVTLSLVFPDRGKQVAGISLDFLLEMIYILPAVLVLMGLFAVWVSKDVVARHLGAESGIKGMLLSMALGALPTGPLYIAFPMGAMLIKKGARIANVMAFLSAWACIKIPQELVELQFMGWRFAAARLVLTIFLIIVMCLSAEFIYKRLSQKETVE